jgi:hypothetical protein
MLELYLGRSLRKVRYETVIFPKQQSAQQKKEFSEKMARQQLTRSALLGRLEDIYISK